MICKNNNNNKNNGNKNNINDDKNYKIKCKKNLMLYSCNKYDEKKEIF